MVVSHAADPLRFGQGLALLTQRLRPATILADHGEGGKAFRKVVGLSRLSGLPLGRALSS